MHINNQNRFATQSCVDILRLLASDSRLKATLVPFFFRPALIRTVLYTRMALQNMLKNYYSRRDQSRGSGSGSGSGSGGNNDNSRILTPSFVNQLFSVIDNIENECTMLFESLGAADVSGVNSDTVSDAVREGMQTLTSLSAFFSTRLRATLQVCTLPY